MQEVLSSLNALGVHLSPAAGADLSGFRQKLSALEELTLAELNELDTRAQAVFHDLLLESARGPARDACFRAAYAVVPAVLCERRRRQGQTIDGFGIGQHSVQRVLTYLGQGRKRVVDVGCSSGMLVQALLEAGHDARGIELSRQLVDLGSQRLSSAGFEGARLVCSDFLRLQASVMDPLRNADLIWSNDVLEHLHPDDVPEFFARCLELLAPGGTLWLITPSGLTQGSRKTLHLRQYFLSELLQMARSAGFSRFRARLVGSTKRQAWPMNVPARVFVPLKLAAEPLIKRLPRRARIRTAKLMAYSELFLG